MHRILCTLHLRTCGDCLPEDPRPIEEIIGRTEQRADDFLSSGNWVSDMIDGTYHPPDRPVYLSPRPFDDADGAMP